MEKIDIYNNEKYLCTTTQSKTCKNAVNKFIDKPWYEGLKSDGTIGTILVLNCKDITARFQN